ncbi:hypothetical protein CLV91_1165 [Maribacter vaceletii]|uniref:Nitrite reductase/ring-hydroxylating ferredoxin subunit n=1 Tax=Maribacter vaceletii TaxID=1206816 RepID=A0A495EEW9_9FLAO|nr:hypothetical protein [Maribacter vaceletii]RKR15083.1 hypothetical protein CLV91_1165 [Maribacter vaceletii]
MKYIFSFFLISILFSCSSDRGNRNPYLQEIGFRFEINLNLPKYSPLTNVGNAVYVNANGVGTKGAFVINSGFNQYLAFEASCPNHAPNECSTMTLNGQEVTCSCEEFTYNLFTGQLSNTPKDGGRYYDMLNYNATGSGNIVSISN